MKRCPPPCSRVALRRRSDQVLPPSPWEQQSRQLLKLWQQRLQAAPRSCTREAA